MDIITKNKTEIETSAANLNHLGGALVIVFAVVAI